MKLPVEAGYRVVILGLSAALAGCGLVGGGGGVASSAQAVPMQRTSAGPAADYPMVLGEPFTVEGEQFTPADTLNYDAVGFAAIDEGAGVTAAHRTLPLPSYVEVTSLDSGKTILVRVERRGPMTGKALVALSPAAAAQLGVGADAAVRVRRVNPPEAERAELRAGRPAPERIETPRSLVEVLRRKLPAAGAATLSGSNLAPALSPRPGPTVAQATPAAAHAAGAYPLPKAPDAAGAPHPAPASAASHTALARTAAPKPPAVKANEPKRGFVVQAGTFASRANAERAAKTLGGFVSTSGAMFRVRTGPFATRAQADVALAKVRAAGYSDARVTTTG